MIGMLSILVSACGSEDSTNPRAYDKTGPEIIITGNAIIELNIGDAYVDEGATARDVWDGNNVVDQDPLTDGIQAVATSGVESIDTSNVGVYFLNVGVYLVTYTAEDSNFSTCGNISTATRTIDVNDRVGLR